MQNPKRRVVILQQYGFRDLELEPVRGDPGRRERSLDFLNQIAVNELHR